MRITLMTIHAKYCHSALAPWLLFAALKERGIQTENTVLEGTIHENETALLDRITATKPDVLGFSCYIWNIEIVLRLAAAVKTYCPDVIIICGGPEAAYNSETLLARNPAVDYVVSEIPEENFSKIISDLLRIDIQKISTSPVSPYNDDYFKTLGRRIIYAQTSTGCPFNCSFCVSSREALRFYDLETSKKTLLRLANANSAVIKLVDRTFNANPERAYELFAFLIDNAPENVCYHMELSAMLLNLKTVEMLKTARDGLFQFEFGIQSTNPLTLQAIYRKQESYDLVQALASMGNIHIHVDLIAGLPYEGLAEFTQSFNTAYGIKAHDLQLGFLKFLHGTDIRKSAESLGYEYNQTPPYEILSSKWLSSAELDYLRKIASALERVHNSGYFTHTVALLDAMFSPLDLYARLADFGITHGISLTSVTEKLYIFMLHFGADRLAARDVLVLDCLETTGFVPKCLAIYDRNLKFEIIKFEKVSPPITGVRRKYALVYTGEMRLVAVEYTKKHPVTGRFELMNG